MGEHMAGALQRGLPLHTKANGAQRGVQLRLGHGGTLKGKGLPQPGQQPFGRAALQKHALRPGDQRGRDRHQRFFRLSRFDRKLFGPACSAALALSSQRADLALWRTVGQADQRPQFHQRLVIRAGAFLGHFFQHTGCELALGGRFGNIGRVIIQPGKYPQHVAVHRRGWDAKCNGGNSPSRVIPNAGQSAQGGIICGKLAAVLPADDLRRLLHVGHPAVIPQPLPQLAQLVRVAGGKGGGIRQFGHKTLVIGQRRRDAGLLEHDLADPDMICRRLLPERQEPSIQFKPLDQRFADRPH